MGNGPTWYDILGVEHTATPDQIKAAWRDATDKFEPGSGQGQFRLFNEAADVLLDPERRREYDAGLTGSAGSAGPAEQPAAPPTSPRADEPQAVAVADAPTAADVADRPAPEPTTAGATGRSPLVLVLAALSVAALLFCLVFAVLIGHRASSAGVGFLEGVTDGDAPARADAGAAASGAAQRALAAALSYDYHRLPADRARALGYMTKSYGKTFADTFDKLLTAAKAGEPNNVVKTQTVVKATVLQTGVMNPAATGVHRVRVLAYVDQTATKGGQSPTVFQNRVAVTMVEQHGAWLIDGLTSY